jgi:DNA helicase-2/ATP-dependent DNA helicase PcrA
MTVRLTDIQKRVVAHGDGALLVVAGPGSGKTRVLTERIRRLVADNQQHFRVLALTFTNKAANEVVERLNEIEDVRKRCFVGTLHSFCMEVLANRGASIGIDGLPNIFESFDDRRQVLAEAIRSEPSLNTLLRDAGDQKQQQKRLGEWLARISELKNQLLVPEAVEDETERRIYEAYTAGLRASAAVDYDDLLLLTYRLFTERPKIAEFYQRQYRYVCIDEAQDLNEAQYRLLLSLCGANYKNVLMVGDPRQAIYVWNGANPKYLELFVADFGAETIELNENFRSSRTVVSAAKHLDPTYEIEGQLPIIGQVEVVRCRDESAEAEAIIDRLTQLLVAGHPDIEGSINEGQIAILGRNRFVFSALEEKLSEREIRYHKTLSSAAYRSESDVVEQFELALRMLANPRDQLHLSLLVKAWGVPEVIPAELRLDPISALRHLAEKANLGHAKVVFDAINALQWTSSGFRFTKAIDLIQEYAASQVEEERALIIQDAREWRQHWDAYVRSTVGGAQSVQVFLSQVALGMTQQAKKEGIALLTVHAAKGMEFDVVFLIGMTEGVFPDYRAKGTALEEECRSAFVAVTRSRRLLFLSYPEARMMPWGDIRRQTRSRFISAIEPSLLAN